MYRTVHSWATEEQTGVPFPAIVEDTDGIRILTTAGPGVLDNHYRQAIESGVQGILNYDPMFGIMFIDAEKFARHRTENSGHHVVKYELWHNVEPASFIDMRKQAADQPPSGWFVNLHTHCEFSPLDGYGTIDEIVERIVADGQPALAITDHGFCSAHPSLQAAANTHGFKPIFGLEAYLVDDRFARNGKPTDYWHICLWALDNEGLTNLWAMSTESFRDGLYGKYPRLDWDTLRRHADGVAASTGCLGGPLAKPWAGDDGEGDPEAALANLSKLRAIFGDRLYAELHTNQLPVQKDYNRWLVDVAHAQRVPLLAVADAHYACPEHKDEHETWIAVQIHKEIGDDSSMFEGHPDLHVHTGHEALAALHYLGGDVAQQAIAETVALAERCSARIDPRPSTPTFSRPTRKLRARAEAEGRELGELRRERDVHRLLDLLEASWARLVKDKTHGEDVYEARLSYEFSMYARKGFCGYVLILAEIINYAREQGILIGPGRGSGGGSLVLYLAGITDIDPIEHDLLFERFMTEGRTSLPDVDTDFPSTHKQTMLDFVTHRWGAEQVVTVGTHLKLRNKGAINNTAQAMKASLPEDYYLHLQKVSKLIDSAEASSAGLGISWEELWAQHEDELAPYAELFPDLFEMAGRLHGRLKSYGRHAAGVVIDTDHSIEGALPLRAGEADPSGKVGAMITQFDMEALEWLGYVKFDFLNLRTLDTLQHAVDLVARDTGARIDFRAWREEYADPEVFETLTAGWTKGAFQIETTAGTRMCKRFGPTTMAELADVITLVRPGPMNSGLTEEYLQRRAGEHETSFDDPRLETVLAKTYGLMIYQEDIMAVCMVLAGYDSNEADAVRKILGKKQVEKVAAEGKKFVARAVANGTDREVATQMWGDMAEFAKYSFNRAHAFAYAVLGYQTAWMKVHYPVQMMAALLSTVDQDRIGEFVEEARRLGIQVLPPDINESGRGFSSTTTTVRYGLDSIKGVGAAGVDAVIETQPYTSYADFIERRSTKCNMGQVKTLVRIGAFDTLEPNRRGLEAFIAAEEQPGTARCTWLDTSDPQDIGLPCAFDWANEPVAYGRPNRAGDCKPLKPKPLPKKCTRACRQFAPKPPPDPTAIEPYTDGDIGAIEQELLGVRLSTSEFDRIPAELRAELHSAQEVALGPPADYTVAALISGARRKKDRYQRDMAWLSLTTPHGPIENIVVFSSKFENYGRYLSHPGLVLVIIRKDSGGLKLVEMAPA